MRSWFSLLSFMAIVVQGEYCAMVKCMLNILVYPLGWLNWRCWVLGGSEEKCWKIPPASIRDPIKLLNNMHIHSVQWCQRNWFMHFQVQSEFMISCLCCFHKLHLLHIQLHCVALTPRSQSAWASEQCCVCSNFPCSYSRTTALSLIFSINPFIQLDEIYTTF